MTDISAFESEIASIQNQLDEALKESEALVYNFISEDIRAWIESGGCVRCNGAGHIYYWKDNTDTIACPDCDGNSPDYSLSYTFPRSAPNNYYFPEIDSNLAAKRYPDPYYGAKIPEKIIFWSNARIKKKDSLSLKISALKADLSRKKAALAEEIRVKAKQEVRSAAVSNNTLPALLGVSKKQIGFGNACRKAAIDSGAADQDALINRVESSYWIDNYKQLLGR